MTSRRDLYEELFYHALRIRRVEERIIELYPSDRVQSPVHLCIGQEAIPVGVCRSLKPTDLLFGFYRSHGWYLAKGGGMPALFAELFGKSAGGCGGKAGSMHLAAPEVGLMGASAVVASTIPHAVGAALAAQRLGKQDQIIVSVFGDGATEEGVYHESLNFAALHQLPILFVCENNGLAVHSRLEARQSYRIVEHARAYGLSVAACADGYDLMKVHAIASELIEAVRQERAPRFLEVTTYRYREHVGPNEDFDAGYRSRAERDAWMARDPLIQDARRLQLYGSEIQAEIDAAVAFAERSPSPGQEALVSDVL